MASLRDIHGGRGPAGPRNRLQQDSWSVLGCVQPRAGSTGSIVEKTQP